MAPEVLVEALLEVDVVDDRHDQANGALAAWRGAPTRLERVTSTLPPKGRPGETALQRGDLGAKQTSGRRGGRAGPGRESSLAPADRAVSARRRGVTKRRNANPRETLATASPR